MNSSIYIYIANRLLYSIYRKPQSQKPTDRPTRANVCMCEYGMFKAIKFSNKSIKSLQIAMNIAESCLLAHYLQLEVVVAFESVESVGNFGQLLVRLFFVAILRFIAVFELLLSPLSSLQVFA